MREDGREVGSEIEALDARGSSVPMREISPGKVLVGPLAAGRYTFRARREGKVAQGTVEVAGGETTALEVVLDLE